METKCKSGLFLAVVFCLSLPAAAGLVLDFQAAQHNTSNLSISFVSEAGSASSNATEQFIKGETTVCTASCTYVPFTDITTNVSECPVDLVPVLHIPKDSETQSGDLFISGLVSNLLLSTGR